MGSNKDRAIRYRKQGKSYQQISDALGVGKPTIWGYLKAAGLVQSYGKRRQAKKVVQASSVAAKTAPASLNGLGKVWLKAEKLIDRAKRIKAAVKELNKALHY